MNTATCSALTAVFPLILLAVTQQRRDVHLNIRRLRATRLCIQAVLVACLAGLAWSLLGTERGGFHGASAVFGWLLVSVACVGLGYIVVAIHATVESEEDEE